MFIGKYEVRFFCVHGILFGTFWIFLSTVALAYDGLVILGFGDSITVGYPYLDGYAAGCNCGMYEKNLEQMLNDCGHPNLVFNWGYSGESTAGGMNRIESNIQTAINQWGHVDFILLMEGTNDYDYGFSPGTTRFNLDVMIEKVRGIPDFHITPILGTLTPDTANPAKSIPSYNAQIRDLALQKNVLLVDHYSAMVDNWGVLNYDGLHPNEHGYYQLASQWFKGLQPLVGPCGIVPTGAYLLLLRH